ncbi:MAG: signal transduction histidine kinase [Planctomycetota bacterium]
MKRSAKTWLLFAMGVVVVLGVMAYISTLIVDGEVEKERSRLLAEHQGKERTALWRLDSALSPLVINETGRAIVAITTPLASYGEVPPFFELFFTEEDRAVSGYGPTESLSDSHRKIISALDLERIKAKIGDDKTWSNPASQSINRNISTLNGIAQQLSNFDNNDRDIRAQRRNLNNSMNPMSNSIGTSLGLEALTPYSGYWTKDEAGADRLLLGRPKGVGENYQFVLVDWPKLESWLTEQIQMVLPNAKLRPIEPEANGLGSALLTELPLQLLATPKQPATGTGGSISAILISGWGAVLIALICIAFVLHFSLRLGDRRARFVSTVTHELRTPITTFRMYSQMLADGMIPTEEKRASYLQTLKEQSERISRVLESVLLYSRLEEGRAAARKEPVSVAELSDSLLVPMARQAKVYGLVLNVNFSHTDEDVVNTDSQVVEQIMLNLLDNVAKYASAVSSNVEFECSTMSNALIIDLADHGPGVPIADQKKIFKEFHRGEGCELDGFSGLGLGLALGRDLARELGGDLTLVLAGGPGARFRLTLPLHSS